ncbi:MAG: hypothetical protein ACI4MB_00725 [Candidatus Coproplasma sp.]
MSNYDLNRHKKGDKVKWVLTLIVGILLAAACAAALTMGIKNNGWFKPTENTPVEDTGGITDPDDNTGEDNGGGITDPDDNTGEDNGGETTDPDDNTGEDNGGETIVTVLQSATFDGADGISSNSFFTVTGNQSTGTYTTPVGELTKALKVESSTSIAFTTEVTTTVTIYTTETYVGKTIKVDGTAYTFAADEDGYIVAKAELAAGAHTITKGDTAVFTYLTLTTVK